MKKMKHTKKIIALVMAVIMVFGMAAVVTANEPLEESQKEDRFVVLEYSPDGALFSMISADGELVIHVFEDTPIYFEDETDARERLVEGQTLEELMDGRMLVVSYSILALSYPPQTSPSMIVIMYEEAVPLPETVDPVDVPLNGEVVVKGEIIEAPAPYINEAGVVMVPIRAIAEALGYEVTWNHYERGVRLGVAINIWIDRDEYHVGRMAPISLGVAPELTNGHTYVPMTFFRYVVANVAIFVFEGQVVVVDAEENDME
jgi:hypothetical protein